MKRFFILCLAIILCFGIAGCSNQAAAEPTDPPETVCNHNYTSVITREATYDAEGEMTYSCSKCDSTYTEVIAKLEKHIVPADVLNKSVSNAKYYVSAYSISVGKLVNSAVENYKITHYSGEDAIKNGFLKKSQIDSSVDCDYLYCTIISGDTMLNPEIPYLTEYEPEAVKVWTIFNENDELLNYGVELCDNLETCAIIIMTSGY